MNQTLYTPEFYAAQVDSSRRAAEIILGLLFPILDTPKSVCDVGCGTGCWLDVARGLGAERIFGFDGEYARESLVIPETCFCDVDINEWLTESSMWAAYKTPKHDLCMCLETAEHLEPESADPLVAKLVDLSNAVLFSAAIPGQGGTGHINEQWTGYWVKLFRAHDYTPYDVIRPKIWEDQRIPFWYRQNTLLFMHAGQSIPYSEWRRSGNIPTIVHPELYMQRSAFFH